MSHCDHIRLLAALTKAGATISNPDERRSDLFHAVKGGRVVIWYTQEGFPNKERRSAVCVHTPSPHTDVQTDCFCDRFHHTIKSAVAALA